MEMHTVNKACQQANEKIESGEVVVVHVEDIIGLIEGKGFIFDKVC